jgi:6-pyruvoyl-tetrahydropterin synthase
MFNTNKLNKLNKDQSVLTSCSVCIDDKRVITCPACRYQACSECIVRYLNPEPFVDPVPKCMSCKAIWTFEFLYLNFSTSFNNVYKTNIAKLLFERQKTLLPYTQIKMQEHATQVEKMKEQMNELKRLLLKEKDVEVRSQLKYQISSLKLRCNRDMPIEENLNPLEIPIVKECIRCDSIEKKDEKKTEKDEPCKGFINTADYKCTLCRVQICKHCRLVEHPGKCDSDLVKTIKLLKKETKPCPKCSVPIYKIDGCDQMWCVQCHTAFSWTKGIIEKGKVHNPHYYEFKRKNGGLERDVNDVKGDEKMDEKNENGCRNVSVESIIRIWMIKVKQEKLGWRFDTYLNVLDQAHRLSVERENGHLHPLTEQELERRNEERRVKYSKNILSEKQFITELKKDEKRKELQYEESLVYIMVSNVIRDILYNYVNHDVSTPQTVEQLNNLKNYANDVFYRLGERFKVCVPHIDDKWTISRVQGTEKKREQEKQKHEEKEKKRKEEEEKEEKRRTKERYDLEHAEQQREERYARLVTTVRDHEKWVKQQKGKSSKEKKEK